MLGTINAIQYTRKNIDLIIEAFGFNPDYVSISYNTGALKFGLEKACIRIGQWIVKVDDLDNKHGFSYMIVEHEVAYKLFNAIKKGGADNVESN